MDNFTASIVTIAGVFIGNLSIMGGLFLWVRAEARSDARHNDLKMEATRDLVRSIYDENKALILGNAKQNKK